MAKKSSKRIRPPLSKKLPAAVNERFPAHGWCEAKGEKGLLLPVLSALKGALPKRQAQRLPERPGDTKFPKGYHAFAGALRSLVISLGMVRELARTFPLRQDDGDWSKKDALIAWKALQRTPVLVHAAYTHLKRCGKLFVVPGASLLFRGPLPKKRVELTGLLELLEDERQGVEMLVDREEAVRLFRSMLSWVYAGSRHDPKKGIRDELEHEFFSIQPAFSVEGTGSLATEAGVQAFLMPGRRLRDALSVMRSACGEMASFFEAFCRLVGYSGSYDYGDLIPFVGEADDGVYYWPRIDS